MMVAVAAAAGFALAARMLDVVDKTKDADRPAGTASVSTAEDSTAKLAPSDTSRETVGEQREVAAEPAIRREDEHLNESNEVEPAAARLAAEVQSRSDAETNQAQVGTARGVDESVIGLGFPVSASIRAACEFSAGRRPVHSCEPNDKLLSAMAEEPRSEPWASSAEGAIRALAEQEPGKYTIRALECRSSICFIETGSLLEGFHSVFYQFEKNSGLSAGFPIHGTETAADGSKVYVTLYPFVRK